MWPTFREIMLLQKFEKQEFVQIETSVSKLPGTYRQVIQEPTKINKAKTFLNAGHAVLGAEHKTVFYTLSFQRSKLQIQAVYSFHFFCSLLSCAGSARGSGNDVINVSHGISPNLKKWSVTFHDHPKLNGQRVLDHEGRRTVLNYNLPYYEVNETKVHVKAKNRSLGAKRGGGDFTIINCEAGSMLSIKQRLRESVTAEGNLQVAIGLDK